MQFRLAFAAMLSFPLSLLPVAPLQAASPSFDCAKADHDMEELVCADGPLAALDRQLAEVYALALKNYPADETRTLKATQRGWVKGRNDCWKGKDPRACVEDNYRLRITELQIGAGALEVPAPVRYRCDGDEYDGLTAVFYDDTAMPAVVLTHAGGADRGGQSLAYHYANAGDNEYGGQDLLFTRLPDGATLRRLDLDADFACQLLQ